MEEEGNIDINKCTAMRLRSIVKNSELNQIDFKTQRSSNLENYSDNISTTSPISNGVHSPYSNLNKSNSSSFDINNVTTLSQRKARYEVSINDPPPPLNTSWSTSDFDK